MTGSFERIEVITGVARRRRWSIEEKRRIVAASRDGRMFVLTVDDDSSGLAPEQRQAALSPGIRLDHAVPGSGLGLAVVGDLVCLYGGEIELAQSPLGGLRSVLRLPVIVNNREA